ncbi:MAG TPA: ABC transporter permease [Gemmatimonadaceae bacterium]|nr:ABC transporter permease [Gemmatimonadaceae bacterium]
MSPIASLFAATVRTATPLLLAGLGELVTERAGVINIGLEGSIIAGAFGATVAAGSFGTSGGYVGGMLAGGVLGLLLALFVVFIRADQIITGTAITLLALGLTGAFYRALYGATGVALSLPTSSALRIPGLASLPWVGAALFNQPPVTYVAYALVPTLWWFLYRTHAGLGLRAIGESPGAASAAGISIAAVRVWAILFGALLGGLAGATLVLAQAGTFAEGMSAGRGFIAIAIVALGRWNPFGVAVAAGIFGMATAVQYVVQALGWPLHYELVLMLPYALTLFALMFAPRSAAPAMLGRSE